MVPQDLDKQIKEIIARVIELDAGEITPDADFINDLGVDSLKAIEITGAIEKAFRVVVPEEKIRDIRTLNQAVSLTKQLLEAKG
ncbi:MAG: acyl carrier protein [Candidatus Omnitrophica bacterium]|nr:acyl carrier protein [Candidatus Omnitrophota bacterium]MBU2044628.1 acyl carrier protein [Candidatus Omnitrophota bacterium]MBU2250931.1 acyl carrier protein [Candidatus Omnitrophota bacterium]MBU2474008.1 acyl carrier protein [Candidatus Omnitrophota bacterium]